MKPCVGKREDVGAGCWIFWVLPPSSYLSVNGHTHTVTLKVFTEFDQYREHIFQIKKGDFDDWVKVDRDVDSLQTPESKVRLRKSSPEIAKEGVT